MKIGHLHCEIMKLETQAAVLLVAMDNSLLGVENILRWLDTVIVALEKPLPWMIELYSTNSPHLVDFYGPIKDLAADPLPLHAEVQVLVLAYNAKLMALDALLDKLFQVMIIDRNKRTLEVIDEKLVACLRRCDQQENVEVARAQFQAEFSDLFNEYSRDTDEIAAVLGWRNKAARFSDSTFPAS